MPDRPVPHRGIANDDIEYHRRTASSYDEVFTKEYSVLYEYALRTFFSLIPSAGKAAEALDLGCGTGFVTLALARKGFRVAAVDHSPHMIKIAEKKAEAAGLSSLISFEISEAGNLKFNDSRFDCVTCQGMLHHLEDLGPAVTELIRVLKKGGVFYLFEPCAASAIPGKVFTALLPLARAARRLLEGFFRASGRRGFSRVRSKVFAPGEKPINPQRLLRVLADKDLSFRFKYLTYLPSLRRISPVGAMMFITRLLSFPWRRRRGNVIFIIGKKGSASSARIRREGQIVPDDRTFLRE